MIAFTLNQIQAAHAKVKTGSDFPAYIKEIKALGVTHYKVWVSDGHTTYNGANHFQIASPAIYPELQIARVSSPKILRENIFMHQQGQTDYLTFCTQAAQAGVEKWVVDTQRMLCIYYDLAGNEMITEPIPLV